MSFTLGTIRLMPSLYRGPATASLSSALAARMADQNAQTILQRPGTTERAQAFGGLLSKARAMQDRATELLSLTRADSPRAHRVVTSGDDSAVSGSATNFAAKRHFGVSVSQTAAGQQSISDSLDSAATHGFGTSSTIRLSAGSHSTDVSVDLSTAVSNRDALTTVASAINGLQNAGVRAEVVDGENGSSHLSLSATATGASASFDLEDVSGSLVADMGLDVHQSADTSTGKGGTLVAARDAIYAIDNGQSQTSSSNSVSLFDGQATIQLNGQTGGKSVMMSIGDDGAAIADAVDSFLAARDDLMAYMRDNPAMGTASHLADLQRSQTSRLGSLARLGITEDGGNLSVDKDELAAAIGSGISSEAVMGLARSAAEGTRSLLDDASRAVTHPAADLNAHSMLAMEEAHRQATMSTLIDPTHTSLLRLSQNGIRVRAAGNLSRGLLVNRVG